MLTYSDQLILLTVDPVTGRPYPIANQVFDLTLAGALLFDASFRGLINDDWQHLTVINSEETGDTAIDEVLWCLRFYDGPISLGKAMAMVAAHGSTLKRLVFDSLYNRELLVRKKNDLIFRSQNQELSIPDLPMVIDVHKKIRETVLHDEVPDFQMPALISLMVGSGLTKFLFKPDEVRLHQDKITWLAGMESLGREIIHSIKSLENADLDQDAAVIIGLNHDEPKSFAGGMDSVLSSLSYLYKEAGILRGRKIIANLNQENGFACSGCAWPNPDKSRSHFEFCESGAKNVSAEATSKRATPEFFNNWPISNLLLTSDYWLGQQGRITHPMFLDENSTHYREITWDQAFEVVAREMKSLNHPDEAVFYASGRTSNEAAYLYQLFARTYGTNNLPSSANLCHESSGKALTMSLGFGKSSVKLDDIPKADAIFILGHNPGSNHPRMLKSLEEASRNGCRIVAVNPMTEASLMGFADPQSAGSWFGRKTKLTSLYLQPRINGDWALVRGIVKAVLEAEISEGGILDHDFIQRYTNGFEQYKQTVLNSSWLQLVESSGVDEDSIREAASIYYKSNQVIAAWCLGIAHHLNSVGTIREIVNLMLLRGNIGKPGAGVYPIRGHSNIQGIRSVGVGENMSLSFLESLERYFSISIPKTPGMSVIPAIKSIAEGKAKILFSLGGNLAQAVPDTAYTEQALRNLRLTVNISTHLNRSHLLTGKKALILPCLTRSEEDMAMGSKQSITVEDAMGKIARSIGCLSPSSTNLKSEVSIIAGLARIVLENNHSIDWQHFASDNSHIRAAISSTIPSFGKITSESKSGTDFYLDNPLRNRIFPTSDSKAYFSNEPLEMEVPLSGELMLMTIRSHDQFNTSIFGLNDRYRGINNERRVLFMNREDMDSRKILAEQIVSISSNYDNKERRLDGYYALPYPIRQGCVAAYFPEANALLSINSVSHCGTPSFKSVRVQVFSA
jgi:molybdopterin-dependent oxidoreductase alpha subunit